MTIYHYRGQKRDGGGVIGATDTAPEPFVSKAFRNGWQWLDMTDDQGERVGSIGPHPDTHKRIWWAIDG